MRKIFCFFVVLLFVFVNLNLLFADDVEFRQVVSRNDQVVGGELHLDLEMRITNGISPRTLNSMTVDVVYGSEITEWSSDPSTNWAFSFLDGYSRSTQRNIGFYRVLVTGPNVNANGILTPPGDPTGWDVTTGWQTICTLQWTINTATSVNITINDATDAAAYFDNYTNAPQGGVTDFTVTNQDIGDITLPVESPQTIEIPSEFYLSQNYPNPFNPSTHIEVGIPYHESREIITVDIFNILGKKIRTLFEGFLSPGVHQFTWDGRNDNGFKMSGGIYFYYLKSKQFTQIRKMILLK